MLKYTVLANCQSLAISENLGAVPGFSELFKYIRIPPVHLLHKDKDSELLDVFSKVDLLIYQPVLDKDRFGPFCSENVVSLLKKDTKSLCVPSLYYSGYFPTMGVMANVESALGGVHDYLIVAAYLAGYNVGRTVSMLVDPDMFPLEPKRVVENHVVSVRNLSAREQDNKIDVGVSQYINDMYQEVRLFHQFNHPSVELVSYLCSEICARLGVSTSSAKKLDVLDNVVAPIYGAVSNALRLKFDDVPMKCGDHRLTVQEVVEKSFATYSQMDRGFLSSSLEKNKKFVQKYF